MVLASAISAISAISAVRAEERELPAAIQAMLDALEAYDRAVRRADAVRTKDAWIRAVKCWQGLSLSDQEWVEDLRPGTRAWMEGGGDYPAE